ncbi:MAG: hypothetical protein VW257_05725, partial [Quisquiliibacterium sp.]
AELTAKLDATMAAMAAMVARAEGGEAYDQMIGEGNAAGNATVQAAIGGQAAGDVYESGSDRHFPMVVRLASRYRESLDAINRIQTGARHQANEQAGHRAIRDW